MIATQGLLSGLRVLELGHFVAAPFCTRLLADLGADVIKVEPLAGDPVRQWGRKVNGVSAWWSVHARNKRLISLDLKSSAGLSIAKRLIGESHALVENFRPGHLAKLGLSDDEIRRANPGIVISHISGFGQTGPYSDRAAFGVIGEAVGGLRFLCNHASDQTDLPPVRMGVSFGDSLAGLYSALGIVAALWHRSRGLGEGANQTIDVALSEAVLSFTEGLLPEFGTCGFIRQPEGSRISTAAPSNAYPTADGEWIIIAANSEPLFEKLCSTMELPSVARDPRFEGNASRVENARELDAIISAWSCTKPANKLISLLEAADIPNTKIYSAADCAADPQFRARGMVREIDDPQIGKVLHPGIVPHVPSQPGSVRWPGGPIGSHSDSLLADLLGFSPVVIAALRADGVVR